MIPTNRLMQQVIPNKLVVTGSDPKSNPSSDPKSDTHATNRDFAQKLLISRFVPKVVSVVIRTVDQPITDDVVGVQDLLSLHHTVLPKLSVTDAAYSCTRMNFVSNSVLSETPKFMDLGMSPAHTTDKLKSVIGPTTIYRSLMDHSKWLASRHIIAGVTEGRVIEVQAYSDYI